MTTTVEQLRTYQGPALFSFGFRPFFLSAAIWAALAVPVWLATYLVGPGTTPFETGLVWHVHEMVFGYGAAVVAGFLLTAIPNWTGRLPVSGMPLVLLWLLWCAGRLAFTLEPVPDPLGALIESAFLICFAALVWREVIAGRNTRNLKVAGAVSVFAAANVAFHILHAQTGGLPNVAIETGLATLLFLILLIGGRITPSFTRNWLAKRGHDRLPAPFSTFDAGVLIVSLLALIVWILPLEAIPTGAGLVLAAALNLVRLARWRGVATSAEPLVTILHIGYAWAVVAILLLGLNGLFPASVPRLAGLHAAGTGAIGVMTLAVMTRASLGHTGHVLTAGSGTLLAYLLINLAALTRVGSTFLAAPAATYGNQISGVLWTGAFLTFCLVYGPRLVSARRTAAA